MVKIKKQPEFDYSYCIACGVCVQDCPVSCLGLSLIGIDKYQKAYPQMHNETCIGCGICANNCPMGAIEMKEQVSA